MPKVGICLLNWNGMKYTATCILSIIEQDYKNIKIFVLDQGSTDGSLQWLKKLNESGAIDLTDVGKNVGFSTGNNMLTEKALKDGCEYVLIFNNDTRAFPDMISTMVKCFEDNKDCGGCGVPAYTYDHGLKNWSEAKRIPGVGGWIRRDDDMIQADGFGKYWTDGHVRKCIKCGQDIFNFGMVFNGAMNLDGTLPTFTKCPNCGWDSEKELYVPCDYVGGGCLMLSKEVINKVGMFDTNYDPLYEEDVDLCCRIRESSYKVIHINNSGFNHAVSAFTSGYKRGEFWERHQKNKAYFVSRWKEKIDAGKV